jgi:hypothetical protein
MRLYMWAMEYNHGMPQLMHILDVEGGEGEDCSVYGLTFQVVASFCFHSPTRVNQTMSSRF